MDKRLRGMLDDPDFRERWRLVQLDRMRACHVRGLPFRFDETEERSAVIKAGPLAECEFNFLAAMNWLAWDLGWEE